MLLTRLLERCLVQCRVQFNLVRHGLVLLGGSDDHLRLLDRKVRYANRLHKLHVNQLFHLSPCGRQGNLLPLGPPFLVAGKVMVCGLELAPLRVDPAGGPVDQVEVKVTNLEVFDGLLAFRDDELGVVAGIPEFGGDEEILSLDYTFIEEFLQSPSHLLLVLVNLRAVNVTEAGLDSLLESGAHDSRGSLPGAVPKGRDRVAVVQRNDGLHSGSCRHNCSLMSS
mmetsp:Transcript_24916/g.48786  ORF Transcript_24916/g.48786 Transcript_24916/m.48786 type:complete len:224 (-) Transcript_24916:78-749(-)